MDRLQTPPHSVEAEQAVLGGLLLDTQAWDQVGDSIVAEDFYRPDHQLIFDTIADLVAESKPIDVVTVSERLERARQAAPTSAGSPISPRWCAIRPPRPMPAPMRRSCARSALLRALVSAGQCHFLLGVQRRGHVGARSGEPGRAGGVRDRRTRRAAHRRRAVRCAACCPSSSTRSTSGTTTPRCHARHRHRASRISTGRTGGLRGGDLVIVAGRPVHGQDHAGHQHGRERGAGSRT